MNDLHQLKRGFVNPETGLVFWKRNAAMRSGAEWLTASKFDERQASYTAMRASWVARNADRNKANNARYRKAASSSRSAYSILWNKRNAEKRRTIVRRWKAANALEIGQKARARINARLKTDPIFRARKHLRSRLQEVLRQIGFKKSSRTMDVVGCTPDALRKHLEDQFRPGMSWANYGAWHIDHIVPLATASNRQAIERLCHFTNLQPLWAAENLSKGSRTTPVINVR